MFSRRTNFILIFFAFLAGCSDRGDHEPLLKDRTMPNIILIVSDDHGTGDLGCYGNEAIRTPNLDRLASEGVRFNNAYATTASCSASRSVILTGLYNHANGQFGHMHHYHHFSAFDHVQSLPVLLQELGGYRTGRIGKYHLAPESIFHFQEVIKGNSRNPVEMANNTLSFMSADEPFFLYFCTSDPHRSGETLPGDLGANRFGNKDAGYDGVKQVQYDPSEVIVPAYLPDTQQTREELAQYYQSVTRVDQGVGQLFENLQQLKKWDNTIIIYISDNGIAFPGAKTTVYQPGLNLPLIVKNTDQKLAGSVSDDLVNWADLTPTILDLAGVLPKAESRLDSIYAGGSSKWDNTANQTFHGSSFKDVLQGEPSDERKEVFASHTFHEITMYYPMRVVITDRYKLIWNIAYQLPFPHATDLWAASTWQATLKSEAQVYGPRTTTEYTFRPEYELYDLQSDPFESQNLAGEEQYRETLNAMIRKIRKFQGDTNDPWAMKWEHE